MLLPARHAHDQIPSHAANLTLLGLNLRPPGVFARDVTVYLTSADGTTHWSRPLEESYSNVQLMVAPAASFFGATGGALSATVRIAGKLAGSASFVGLVVRPTITPSTDALCANARVLKVYGVNLPGDFCPEETASVIMSGNLVYGEDFEVQHCSETGFSLVLRQGKAWGSAGDSLSVLQYSSSGAINIQVASVVTAFTGTLTESTSAMDNTAATITLSGTDLLPAGTSSTDMTVEFWSSAGHSPVGQVTTVSATSIEVTWTRCVSWTEPGNLFAVVTVADASSSSSIQVATISAPKEVLQRPNQLPFADSLHGVCVGNKQH